MMLGHSRLGGEWVSKLNSQLKERILASNVSTSDARNSRNNFSVKRHASVGDAPIYDTVSFVTRTQPT